MNYLNQRNTKNKRSAARTIEDGRWCSARSLFSGRLPTSLLPKKTIPQKPKTLIAHVLVSKVEHEPKMITAHVKVSNVKNEPKTFIAQITEGKVE